MTKLGADDNGVEPAGGGGGKLGWLAKPLLGPESPGCGGIGGDAGMLLNAGMDGPALGSEAAGVDEPKPPDIFDAGWKVLGWLPTGARLELPPGADMLYCGTPVGALLLMLFVGCIPGIGLAGAAENGAGDGGGGGVNPVLVRLVVEFSG
jgi:hypothetical protein